MTATLSMNGQVRKNLASPLDRLDGILDGLSDGLNDAVVAAVPAAVGLALAAVGLRPGSPLVPLGEWLNYLAGTPVGWTAAWVARMCCAVALIAFLAALTHRLGEHARLAQFGLMIDVVGAAFDLFCDSVY